jgi:tRNA pseudouridine38-40 synthase
MKAHRYFIKLAFNGNSYHGWQLQKTGISVQEVLTRAMSDLLSAPVSLTGCGRTDAGVNAREFYAHFDLKEEKNAEDLQQLTFRLNRYLPADIFIDRIFPVPGNMHARFSALSRTYEFHIHNRKDPFLNDSSYFVYGELDLDLMNAGAGLLKEYDDFTSFARLHGNAKTNICRIIKAGWERHDYRILFKITADRFLRNMVRAIVGTSLDLGMGKISLEDFRHIIESKDRSGAGQSVPGFALYLVKIVYPGLDSFSCEF